VRKRRSSKSRRLCVEQLESRRLLAFDPTGMEQEFIQLTNRMRTDPQGELGRLVSQINPVASADPQIDLNLKFWKVDGNELARQWQSLTPVPPLAGHESLYNAALGHNQQMIANHDQQHQFPGEPNPGDRMKNAGYPIRAWAENIAAYCTTINECHASYAIDWGPGPSGIQSPPKHREILMSTSYREVGIGVTPHTKANQSDVGPLVNTQDFSTRNNIGNPFVIGAVFDDRNASSWYENGEGFGGVTVKFVGATGTFTTTTMSAGGYQINLPAGTYVGTATGGGLRELQIVANVVVGTNNVWVNFRQDNNPLPADRFEPNNDFDTATQLASEDVQIDSVSIHLPDNDDYYKWTSPATGELKVDLTLVHQNGDLDLFLYDAARAQVALANGQSNTQSLSFPVTAGSVWYVAVKGNQRAVNSNYSLIVNGPGGAVPKAVDDKTATNKNTSTVIDIVANDTDADGDLDPTSVQITQQPQHGTITVNAQTGAITYVPTTDFLGVDRIRYTVRDTASLTSQPAQVVVAVVDYANHPWRHPTNAMDIDDSGAVVPQDVLVIINQLNIRGPGPLVTQPTGANSPPPFVDPSGDDFLSSNDALRVINFLNQRSGEGEGEGATDSGHQVVDEVLILPVAVPASGRDASSMLDSMDEPSSFTGEREVSTPDTNWLTASKSAERCKRFEHPEDEVFTVLGQNDESLEDVVASLRDANGASQSRSD
jgi:hypothetical protein